MKIPRFIHAPRARKSDDVRAAGAAAVTARNAQIIDNLLQTFGTAVASGIAPALGASFGERVRRRKASLERNLMRSMMAEELRSEAELLDAADDIGDRRRALSATAS